MNEMRRMISRKKFLRMNGRRAAAFALAVLIFATSCTGATDAQPGSGTAADVRIQELVDRHVLLGAPKGDLQLERNIQKGEFIMLVERVLRLPASPAQSMTPSSDDTGQDRWVRFYAWSRSVWSRCLVVWKRVRQLQFDLRYQRNGDCPWDLARTHWMSAGLRNAFLEDGLIDLSFKPMEPMKGGEAIDLILAAAGYEGEVKAASDQMGKLTLNGARRIVCRQHGLEQLMQYADRTLTRRDAAVMVWQLMNQHAGAS